MPYISKAEIERRRWVDLAAAIRHVKDVDGCEDQQALEWIKAAIQDGKLHYRWEDQARPPRFSTGPTQWVPPVSDMLPDEWELDAQQRLKDTTGRFRVLLLLKFALYSHFEQAPKPEIKDDRVTRVSRRDTPRRDRPMTAAERKRKQRERERATRAAQDPGGTAWQPEQAINKAREEVYNGAESVGEAPRPEITLRPAPEQAINKEIEEVYNSTESAGGKPPNLKEIVAPVQAALRNLGFQASGRQIQNLADADEFKKRRRKPGPTLTNENRRREKP
jgi:hypothetical protein